MGLIDLVGGLLGGVPKAIGDYFTARATAKAQEQLRKLELEDAIHKRKVELVQAGLHADATWELEQIRNSGSKDEWVLFLLSIPLVGCFVPGLADWVLRGFQILEKTPSWYQWMILLIFTAIFGIRIWRRQQSDT
jgi:hypothetical protein